MSSEGKNGMGTVCSFFAGAALGAGLALLFAPQSGKETRKMIKDFSDKIGEDIKDNVEKVSENAKTLYEGTREKFKKKISERD